MIQITPLLSIERHRRKESDCWVLTHVLPRKNGFTGEIVMKGKESYYTTLRAALVECIDRQLDDCKSLEGLPEAIQKAEKNIMDAIETLKTT